MLKTLFGFISSLSAYDIFNCLFVAKDLLNVLFNLRFPARCTTTYKL